MLTKSQTYSGLSEVGYIFSIVQKTVRASKSPGAGNQFGIVTEFVLEAHPAAESALVGALAYPGTELPGTLKALRVSTRYLQICEHPLH